MCAGWHFKQCCKWLHRLPSFVNLISSFLCCQRCIRFPWLWKPPFADHEGKVKRQIQVSKFGPFSQQISTPVYLKAPMLSLPPKRLANIIEVIGAHLSIPPSAGEHDRTPWRLWLINSSKSFPRSITIIILPQLHRYHVLIIKQACYRPRYPWYSSPS